MLRKSLLQKVCSFEGGERNKKKIPGRWKHIRLKAPEQVTVESLEPIKNIEPLSGSELGAGLAAEEKGEISLRNLSVCAGWRERGFPACLVMEKWRRDGSEGSEGGAACHSSSKGQRAQLKSAQHRSPDPCLMCVCMCVYVCVTPATVAHLWASLQGLRMCHINHRPVSKSGELGL